MTMCDSVQSVTVLTGVDLEEDVKVEPVEYGGFILFHNLTPHRR